MPIIVTITPCTLFLSLTGRSRRLRYEVNSVWSAGYHAVIREILRRYWKSGSGISPATTARDNNNCTLQYRFWAFRAGDLYTIVRRRLPRGNMYKRFELTRNAATHQGGGDSGSVLWTPKGVVIGCPLHASFDSGNVIITRSSRVARQRGTKRTATPASPPHHRIQRDAGRCVNIIVR